MSMEAPSEVEFSLTLVGTAAEFEALGDALQCGRWTGPQDPAPIKTLRVELTDLLVQARKIFWPKVRNDAKSA